LEQQATNMANATQRTKTMLDQIQSSKHRHHLQNQIQNQSQSQGRGEVEAEADAVTTMEDTATDTQGRCPHWTGDSAPAVLLTMETAPTTHEHAQEGGRPRRQQNASNGKAEARTTAIGLTTWDP
jgi:hypothetical protein